MYNFKYFIETRGGWKPGWDSSLVSSKALSDEQWLPVLSRR
jgi:hypothetical protein